MTGWRRWVTVHLEKTKTVLSNNVEFRQNGAFGFLDEWFLDGLNNARDDVM